MSNNHFQQCTCPECVETRSEQLLSRQVETQVRLQTVVRFWEWWKKNYSDIIPTFVQEEMVSAHFSKKTIYINNPRACGKVFIFEKIKEFEKENGEGKT